MNIRRKVIFSFIVLIIFIITISILSFISTYQIKENLSFQKNISKLISIQEKMNDHINLLIMEQNLSKVKDIKDAFLTYEVEFENLKDKIRRVDDKEDFVDGFINDISDNNHIKNSLLNLFENEHSIELIFDTIYEYQNRKLPFISDFEQKYPLEKNRRKELEKLIFKSNSLELIQEFGDLKYFSKETLYQHKNQKSLNDWLNSIDKILLSSDIKKDGALELLFKEYREIVLDISQIVINIKDLESKEQELIKKLTKVLRDNKKESRSIEKKIEEITIGFLNSISFMEIVLVSSIVLLTLIISLFISSKLSSIILRLHNGVKNLKDGNYEVNIFIQEDEEFNEIARTFNKMAKNIKENKENLEERIDKRTIELKDALASVQKQKEILESLSNKLAKYLSPQVFDSIFSGKQDVLLESKREYLTVFFSDIKGFTEITDSVEAEVLTNLLNEYLEQMSKIVIKYGGTIDKYIGDCIMVFFGAPTSEGKREDALKCINMAIEMKEQMSRLRIKWQKEGLSKTFHIRMGINSGYCTVGNFGSKNRLDYTIIGGVVNLASRLESNANPDEILISKESYLLVKDEIECKKKEIIQAKGIAQSVQTYEVVSNIKKNTLIEERSGFSLIIDYNEIDKNDVIDILQNRLDDIKKF